MIIFGEATIRGQWRSFFVISLFAISAFWPLQSALANPAELGSDTEYSQPTTDNLDQENLSTDPQVPSGGLNNWITGPLAPSSTTGPSSSTTGSQESAESGNDQGETDASLVFVPDNTPDCAGCGTYYQDGRKAKKISREVDANGAVTETLSRWEEDGTEYTSIITSLETRTTDGNGNTFVTASRSHEQYYVLPDGTKQKRSDGTSTEKYQVYVYQNPTTGEYFEDRKISFARYENSSYDLETGNKTSDSIFVATYRQDYYAVISMPMAASEQKTYYDDRGNKQSETRKSANWGPEGELLQVTTNAGSWKLVRDPAPIELREAARYLWDLANIYVAHSNPTQQ